MRITNFTYGITSAHDTSYTTYPMYSDVSRGLLDVCKHYMHITVLVWPDNDQFHKATAYFGS